MKPDKEVGPATTLTLGIELDPLVAVARLPPDKMKDRVDDARGGSHVGRPQSVTFN